MRTPCGKICGRIMIAPATRRKARGLARYTGDDP
jgi:hypothetical protein